ncbi:hypothetical protein HOY80DRAFT_981050 [Tuber brumale]|nr:hypothetical protein HOY80DRAFT_981050 [Tuber brumale]
MDGSGPVGGCMGREGKGREGRVSWPRPLLMKSLSDVDSPPFPLFLFSSLFFLLVQIFILFLQCRHRPSPSLHFSEQVIYPCALFFQSIIIYNKGLFPFTISLFPCISYSALQTLGQVKGVKSKAMICLARRALNRIALNQSRRKQEQTKVIIMCMQRRSNCTEVSGRPK